MQLKKGGQYDEGRYWIKKIKLESTTGAPIQIFDLIVHEDVDRDDVYNNRKVYAQDNFALGRPVTQSSTFRGKFHASQAVDGNINSTFSHTASDDKSAWLEVDLTAPIAVRKVEIHNRWCGSPADPKACLCRLSDAKIILYDEENDAVFKYSLGDTCNKQVIHAFENIIPDHPWDMCDDDSDCNPFSQTVCTEYTSRKYKYCAAPPKQITEVQEWAEMSNLQEVDSSKKDIPLACDVARYNLGLYAFANQTSHFVLGATMMPSNEEEDVVAGCPPALAFASLAGRKVIFLSPTAEEDVHLLSDFNVQALGSAELKDILDAEHKAEAIDDSKYDLTANTCVHYAAKIWRGLDIEETRDLADFIITNLLKDGSSLEYAKQNAKYDGRRALTSYLMEGDEVGFGEYVKDTVYSQLYINP
ncbi:hypothetical protein HJC23_010078 [Cyclotella cryptica]|uniref:Fucolectin tachylectin-4 pentraxin-1 domain-containing protein n=1 Tax=Cyclotella cryptica TaxID=29204 RepID=A0ABD3Q383_9STRA